MNKTLLIIAMAMVLVMPIISATSVGTGSGITITTEKFKPLVWMCDSRIVSDNEGQPGRITVEGTCSNPIYQNKDDCIAHAGTWTPQVMSERIHNYAFEGEKIHWTVLVMDKNKIEEISEVVGTIGPTQGEGNDVEVECKRTGCGIDTQIPDSCNAKILEEKLTVCDPATMSYYDCTFTVETPASMHGEYFITVEAKDLTGLSSTMVENEYFFLNPTIALSIDGDIQFEDVRPGTDAYSQTILVGNDAEAGSGVMLDMFITGTNFYDPASSGAACPSTNELNLQFFRYFATNGAYSTLGDLQQEDNSIPTVRNKDAEGYVNIQNTMEGFSTKFYREAEIIQEGAIGNYYAGNTLSPGSEMALTFKLSLPEPCVGDFSEGQIYFWGEAI